MEDVFPRDIDLEKAVISALIIDNTAHLEAMPLLKDPAMFYETKHRLVFLAIQELSLNNQAIDISTISHSLKSMGKLEESGGLYNLTQLAALSGSAAHIENHCEILQQYWLKRKLIEKSNLVRSLAMNPEKNAGDVLEYDAKMNDEINEILYSNTGEITYASALSLVEQRVELISKQQEGEFDGEPTGFAKIDRFTGGWQPSDLVIIAARPGMGKTAFILKNIVELGLKNIPCGIFSLEMSTQQLAARTVAINSNFHLSQLIRDGFEKDEYFSTLMHRTNEMRKFPIHIDDRPSLDIRDIITKARIWKRKHNIKILFVDYIQLASDKSKGSHREQEISSISRNLKMLAKELNIPVIALSQLSRSVETRQDKHPKLSDLRESGAIEQDADIVGFLYREHYYNPDAELPMELTSIGANAEFNFAKYRSGSLETKGLYFDSNKVKYMDPEELNEKWSSNDLPKPEADEVPY